MHGILQARILEGKYSFPPAGDLPDPGFESVSLVSPALAGGFFTTVPPGKPPKTLLYAFEAKFSKASYCGSLKSSHVRLHVTWRVPRLSEGPSELRFCKHVTWMLLTTFL